MSDGRSVMWWESKSSRSYEYTNRSMYKYECRVQIIAHGTLCPKDENMVRLFGSVHVLLKRCKNFKMRKQDGRAIDAPS